MEGKEGSKGEKGRIHLIMIIFSNSMVTMFHSRPVECLNANFTKKIPENKTHTKYSSAADIPP